MLAEKKLTPSQCRAARSFLNWSQDDLSKKSKVSKATIADFEREKEKRTPYERTIDDLKRAFEEAGIEFENDEKACGVRLLK